MPFLTTALAVGAIAAGVGSAGASIAGSSAQAGAAKSAAQLQYQEAQNSLAFQEKVYGENVARAQPWVTAGTGAINELSSLTSTPGQGLLTPWTQQFQAPTAAQAAQTPGYQFAVQQGELALQDSAAARGGLLAGGTAKDMANYVEGAASTNYQNTFQNALTQYETAYNTFQNNQTNTYNRLAGVAGTGQTSTAQLGQAGQQAANNVGYINSTAGAQIGGDIQNAAYQTASGYTGAANALTGIPGNLGGIMMLQNLMNPAAQPAYQPGSIPGY